MDTTLQKDTQRAAYREARIEVKQAANVNAAHLDQKQASSVVAQQQQAAGNAASAMLLAQQQAVALADQQQQATVASTSSDAPATAIGGSTGRSAAASTSSDAPSTATDGSTGGSAAVSTSSNANATTTGSSASGSVAGGGIGISEIVGVSTCGVGSNNINGINRTASNSKRNFCEHSKFCSYPVMANQGILEYNTTEGRKVYKTATRDLSTVG